MVTEEELKKDYEEILQSGELNKPQKPQTLTTIQKIILTIVIFTLTFWTIAWLY